MEFMFGLLSCFGKKDDEDDEVNDVEARKKLEEQRRILTEKQRFIQGEIGTYELHLNNAMKKKSMDMARLYMSKKKIMEGNLEETLTQLHLIDKLMNDIDNIKTNSSVLSVLQFGTKAVKGMTSKTDQDVYENTMLDLVDQSHTTKDTSGIFHQTVASLDVPTEFSEELEEMESKMLSEALLLQKPLLKATRNNNKPEPRKKQKDKLMEEAYEL